MTKNEVETQEYAYQNYQQQPPSYAGQYYNIQPTKLYRSTTNKWIAGVCGGLAEHFNTSPTLVRVLWIILTIFSVGAGMIGYLLLWALVEKYPAYYIAQGPYVTQDRDGRIHYHYYYRTAR